MRRVDQVAWGICTAVLVGALAWAALVNPPSGDRHATPEEAREVARLLAGRESFWASEARKAFPGDVWSQRDHFHRQEWDALAQEAQKRGLSTSSLAAGVDRELHEHPGRRLVHAAPCRPRPFYD